LRRQITEIGIMDDRNQKRGMSARKRPVVGWFSPTISLLLSLCALAGAGAAVPQDFEARNVQIPLGADESASPVAVLRIDRVFTDHHRLGFFRVRLLPVLVAQGVRLDFGRSSPGTNWAAGIRTTPARLAHNGSMEWREVSVWLPGDALARLQAERLSLSDGTNADFCLLEGVTLQSEAGPVKMPRAKLRLTGQPGQVVWETGGGNFQWDLFTGKLNSNSVSAKGNSL
jgi:hypothetical protein